MRSVLSVFLAFGFMSGAAEVITFDAAKPGFIPPGWSVTSSNGTHPSRWVVQFDKTAPSRPYVFAQTSSRAGKQDINIALFDQKTFRDADISVDLKLVSGKWDQSGGLVWRFQDTANYYFALASAAEDRVGIYKKTNNVVSMLAHASAPHRIDDTDWNLLKVIVRGPRFLLYFGHRKLLDAQDATLTRSGKAGVWTKADTVAYFDNFRLDKKN